MNTPSIGSILANLCVTALLCLVLIATHRLGWESARTGDHVMYWVACSLSNSTVIAICLHAAYRIYDSIKNDLSKGGSSS